MNLDQVHGILCTDDRSLWHRAWAGGPAYHYSLSSFSGAEGHGVDVDDHPFWAVYRSDVNLTLAWGRDVDVRPHPAGLSFPWQKHFIDQKVSALFADVFWAGALIDRFTLYYIDGGHFLAPHHVADSTDELGEPTEGHLELTEWEVDFGELLSLLQRGSSSRNHVQRAGITVVPGGPHDFDTHY